MILQLYNWCFLRQNLWYFLKSKEKESVVVAYLVNKGVLDYDEKISTYWPEFSQGNKENVTVKNVCFSYLKIVVGA